MTIEEREELIESIIDDIIALSGHASTEDRM